MVVVVVVVRVGVGEGGEMVRKRKVMDKVPLERIEMKRKWGMGYRNFQPSFCFLQDEKRRISKKGG